MATPDPTRSPALAPAYAGHRKGLAAVDSAAPTSVKVGMNFADHERALIQVLPAGGANPTVEVLFWSEAAGAFVKHNAALTKAGLGADVPFEFEVDVFGRIIFVMVTTLAAGTVDIVASAFDKFPR